MKSFVRQFLWHFVKKNYERALRHDRSFKALLARKKINIISRQLRSGNPDYSLIREHEKWLCRNLDTPPMGRGGLV